MDAAWKSEGLPSLLKEIGDPRWDVLEKAQMLMALVYNPEQVELEQKHKKYLEEAYYLMMKLCGEYAYDSEKRKFDALPLDGLPELDRSHVEFVKKEWARNPKSLDNLVMERNRYRLMFDEISKVIYP